MKNNTIKTMEVFAGTVKTALEAHYGAEYRIEVQTITKNK